MTFDLGNNAALAIGMIVIGVCVVAAHITARPKAPKVEPRIEAAQILAGLDELRTLLRTEAARNGFRDPADQPTKHDFGSHV